MKRKVIRLAKQSVWIIAVKLVVLSLLLMIFLLLAATAHVSTKIEAGDIAVFQNELNFTQLRHPQTFADEIVAIKAVQHQVFAKAPMGAGIPDFEPREPSDLMKKHEGLCYDRSRTLDKAFKFIGLQSRHVYLLYRQDRGFLSALLHRGQASHAVTEVKTSKGWMFVDSNTEWIALTREGQVVNADDVWKRTAEFDAMPAYLKDSWWAIRGMYSRKGQLYPSHIIFPNLNLPDLFNWLIWG